MQPTVRDVARSDMPSTRQRRMAIRLDVGRRFITFHPGLGWRREGGSNPRPAGLAETRVVSGLLRKRTNRTLGRPQGASRIRRTVPTLTVDGSRKSGIAGGGSWVGPLPKECGPSPLSGFAVQVTAAGPNKKRRNQKMPKGLGGGVGNRFTKVEWTISIELVLQALLNSLDKPTAERYKKTISILLDEISTEAIDPSGKSNIDIDLIKESARDFLLSESED